VTLKRKFTLWVLLLRAPDFIQMIISYKPEIISGFFFLYNLTKHKNKIGVKNE